MDHEVIFIDDDYDQPQQQLVLPGPSRGARRKRTYNGVRRGQVQQQQSRSEMVFYDRLPPAATEPNPVVGEATGLGNPIPFGSIIVDGQDVYYIQELAEENGQAPTELDTILQQVEQPQPLQPNTMVPLSTADSEGEETESQSEIVPEEPVIDDYFQVDPLELSDIWNDLITANQEILILLELQDLKHHIVDARRIEDQLKNMVCEYCPRVLPDVRAWNMHIKKVHFQTELFECDSCDGKFTYYTRFKDHLNGHTGQRSYQCDECSHQYAFRIGFLVHKILDHIKLNGIYVCPKCDLDCKNAQNYKLHIAKHIDFTPTSPYGTSSYQNTATARTKPSVVVPPALPTVPAAVAKAKRKNQTTTPTAAPVFSTTSNERDKFLDVFESFSKNRISDLQTVFPCKKKKY